MKKPFAPSCERNKTPILNELKKIITKSDKNLLEVGSGTGQHSVYFANEFPWLTWTTSDRKENHEGIKSWLKEADLNNIKGPIEYEVGKSNFPKGTFNLVYICNVVHIISWKKVKTLVKQMGQNLSDGAQVILYGPYNFDGKFTSDSNKDFDKWLKDRDKESGIRHFEDLSNVMTKNGIQFTEKVDMPANNKLLIFTKITNISK